MAITTNGKPVNPVTFPDHLASDKEKASDAYGIQVGRSIESEWFSRGRDGSDRYGFRWNEFHKRRLYARAEQSIQKYKDELSVKGDVSYLNLDWTPIPVMPKFIDLVVNGMSERLFKVRAYAQDAMSQKGRIAYQDEIAGQMIAKPILEKIKENTGIDPFTMNPEDIPETDDELSLHMQLNYKPRIEIAEEVAINAIFDENEYLNVRKQVDYDETVLGIGVAKHEFLPGAGVIISRVDPAYWVHSYTNDPYFKDCFYFGEVKTVPITELRKINPNLTDKEIKTISESSQSWNQIYSPVQYQDIFSKDLVTLLYFNYRTDSQNVWKKKKLDNGGVRVIEKDDTFNPSKEEVEKGRFEKVGRYLEVWYEGIMVMGGDILLKWELAKNMIRPDSATQKAMPMYVACAPRMYQGVIESLTSRMIPFADLVQLTHLKLQQVANRIVPDGVYIDVDGLNSIDLGNGKAYTPEAALSLYLQTGSVIGRSFTQEGELNPGKIPVQQLTSNSGMNKIEMLIGLFNQYLSQMMSVAGLGARDTEKPDPDALVGIQKLAALNSNTATRHILDASLYIYKTMAECVSLRIADILQYADFADEFVDKIGKYNVDILNEIKRLYLHSFGINIEVSPDEEERERLANNITMALNKQDIGLEDVIDIQNIDNIKIANQLLKLRKKKKAEAESKQKMREMAMTNQGTAQSQQIAGQVAMAKISAETESKSRLIQEQLQADIMREQKKAEIESQIMREKHSYAMELEGTSSEILKTRDLEKEKAKDKRVNQQSNNESELIEQRKNNTPVKKFDEQEVEIPEFYE